MARHDGIHARLLHDFWILDPKDVLLGDGRQPNTRGFIYPMEV